MTRTEQDPVRSPDRRGAGTDQGEAAGGPSVLASGDGSWTERAPHPRRRLLVECVTAVMVAGALLLAFVAFQLVGGDLAEERHQRRLLTQLASRARLAEALVAAPSVDGTETSLPPLARGDAVALLTIDAIDLERVVVEGTGTRELALGPGHHRSTPVPGQPGNAVIFGRRTLYGGPFRHLDRLSEGNDIEVVTPHGEMTYEVERVEILGPGDVDVLGQSFVNRLTLVTAHPEDRAKERLVVFARLKGSPAAPGSEGARPLPETQELGLAGDPASWPAVYGWGAALVAALFATRRLYARWLRGPTWLVTTPVLLALALLWFESLARLFPSTA